MVVPAPERGPGQGQTFTLWQRAWMALLPTPNKKTPGTASLFSPRLDVSPPPTRDRAPNRELHEEDIQIHPLISPPGRRTSSTSLDSPSQSFLGTSSAPFSSLSSFSAFSESYTGLSQAGSGPPVLTGSAMSEKLRFPTFASNDHICFLHGSLVARARTRPSPSSGRILTSPRTSGTLTRVHTQTMRRP